MENNIFYKTRKNTILTYSFEHYSKYINYRNNIICAPFYIVSHSIFVYCLYNGLIDTYIFIDKLHLDNFVYKCEVLVAQLPHYLLKNIHCCPFINHTIHICIVYINNMNTSHL